MAEEDSVSQVIKRMNGVMLFVTMKSEVLLLCI